MKPRGGQSPDFITVLIDFAQRPQRPHWQIDRVAPQFGRDRPKPGNFDGVLIVGYSYGYFAARDLVRMGACLTVVEFLALLLLVPFYWPLIGLK
jgi:hypothetical protein